MPKGKKEAPSLVPPLAERAPDVAKHIQSLLEGCSDVATMPMRQGLMEAAASIADFASGADVNRMDLAAAGVIPPLVALVNNGSIKQKEKAAAALMQLAYNNPLVTTTVVNAYSNSKEIIAAGGVPPLVALLHDKDCLLYTSPSPRDS